MANSCVLTSISCVLTSITWYLFFQTLKLSDEELAKRLQSFEETGRRTRGRAAVSVRVSVCKIMLATKNVCPDRNIAHQQNMFQKNQNFKTALNTCMIYKIICLLDMNKYSKISYWKH